MAVLRPFILLLVAASFHFASGNSHNEDSEPVGGVSIDDVIDLDAAPSEDRSDDVVLTSYTGTDGAVDTTVGHGNFIASASSAASPRENVSDDVLKPSPRHLPMTSDDEDLEVSGDGSGSGDDTTDSQAPLTLTSSANVSSTPASSEVHEQKSDVSVTTTASTESVEEEGEEMSTEAVDSRVTSENQVTVSDVVFNGDVWPPKPVKEQRDQKKVRQRWSPWMRTNDVTEVRLRTCAETDVPCNGTEAEVRHCEAENKTCDVMKAVVTPETDDSNKGMVCSDKKSEAEENTERVTQPSQAKPHTPLPQASSQPDTNSNHYGDDDADSNPCAYSLYDVKRGKFLAAQWSLSRLVTQAKVKRWCSSPERYLVLHSPYRHCRRYFDDLCHVSIRCKGRRTTPRTHGDLAERCWREFVHGARLPMGLTDRGANMFLLCQRFAAMSSLGQRADPGVSHFATLFDTKGRAPVASMVRLTQLGDLAWPHTPYFIEHGLIEEAQTTEWLLQKPKSGMVQMSDLGVCSHDYSCQLGANQALPSDYSATTYRVAPLLWPELAGPDPWSTMATMTLTNAAPMHAGLYPLWHRAVVRLRQFAEQQCGVPYLSPDRFRAWQRYGAGPQREGGRREGEEVPAMNVISGVVASRDPFETIGNDINVPDMFWMAVCCVIPVNTTSTAADAATASPNAHHHHHHHHHNHHNHHDYHHHLHGDDDDDDGDDGEGHHPPPRSSNYASYAIYASNAGPGSGSRQGSESDGRGSQVVVAPVAELEQLLEDLKRRSSTGGEVFQVRLFPGSEGACSHPSSDLSTYLHL